MYFWSAWDLRYRPNLKLLGLPDLHHHAWFKTHFLKKKPTYLLLYILSRRCQILIKAKAANPLTTILRYLLESKLSIIMAG